jgi:mono/diheme cytochrome c family protein
VGRGDGQRAPGYTSKEEEREMRRRVEWVISIAWVSMMLSVATAVLVAQAFGADLAMGKSIYGDKCLKCHGEKGRGDGRKAADLEKKPADYTDKAKMAKFTDEDLTKAVKEGKKPMPAFGKKLTDEQIDNVIAYIRTFAGAHAGK